MSTEIARRESLPEIIEIGRIFAKSGYFQDAREEAQAVVKILCGRELGIEPMAAMSGIAIVKGKPTLGANLMAALIRRSREYDYRIVRLDEAGCEIEFSRGGAVMGRSSFNRGDAEQAGLLQGENWKKYPRNMAFARAMSNGAKWYCPDVFAGQTVYSPGELGPEGGPEEIIDFNTGEILAPAQESKSPPEANGNPPSCPVDLRAALMALSIDPEGFGAYLVSLGQLKDGQAVEDLPTEVTRKLLLPGAIERRVPAYRAWEAKHIAELGEAARTQISMFLVSRRIREDDFLQFLISGGAVIPREDRDLDLQDIPPAIAIAMAGDLPGMKERYREWAAQYRQATVSMDSAKSADTASETGAERLARAEALRGQVTLVGPGRYEVPSQTTGGKRYLVAEDLGGWACTCDGYRFRVQADPGYQCVHIMAARLAEPALKGK